MKFLDTKIWAKARLEEGVVTLRLYAGGCCKHSKNGEPVLAVKSFDVDVPEALAKALTKVLEDKREQLESAAKAAAFKAREVAVARGEIKEVV